MEAEEQIAKLKQELYAMVNLPIGTPEEKWRKRARETLDCVPRGVPPPLGKSALMYPDRRDITAALEQLERTAHQLSVDTSALRASLERFL